MSKAITHPENIDNPWRRLPWTLPTAVLIWAVALSGFAYFMEKSAHRTVEPPPIDAQLIEQFPAVTKERPATPKPLHTVRPQQDLVMRRTEQKEEVTTKTAVALPATTSSGGTHATSGEGLVGSAANTASNSSTQAGSYAGKGKSGGNLYATGGARAIIRPMPQIPDDLREEAFNATALARFHVAADGSATVELAKPTPNPRINRILIDSLRKWRFMPAIINGKPVASTEEIVIKIEVK